MNNPGEKDMDDEMRKLIPLDMAVTYPVKWYMDKILRDLVQNFYDSIGYKNFYKEFKFESGYTEGRGYELAMWTLGHTFSYEWLTCIGGSTKTDHPGKYVGMYGEGFKICALCLNRMGMQMFMESGDWRLEVCTYTKPMKNDSEIKMLGYYLSKRNDDGITKLTIKGLNRDYEEELNEAVYNFFYPENPLIGSVIVETDEYAIYRRSEMRVPCEYGGDIEGILFCNYLARGRLPFNLVISIKKDMRKTDKRNRQTMATYESIILLNSFVYNMNACASYQLLLQLKKYWSDMPEELVDIDTLYYIICQLVRNIAADKKYRRKFMRKYTELIYIEKKNSDPQFCKLVNEADVWSKNNPEYRDKRFVNPIFRLVGARSVLDEYKKKYKEIPVMEMDDNYKRLCDILLGSFESVFPYQVYEQRPEILIQNGVHSDPMQFCERDYGRSIKGKLYNIKKLVLDAKKFAKDSYNEAFLELASGLLHVYGTSRSAAYNGVLTHLGGYILEKTKVLKHFRKEWESVCETMAG